jgi:CubicO group peptidase (beta-lactamase class C family)
MNSCIRTLPAFVLVLVLAAPAAAGEDAATRVKAAIEEVMKARGLGALSGPGCAISVTDSERSLFSGGVGSANIEHQIPFGPQTVSESGSVAKQFMAASILMLAEQGRLSLEDDVRRHLPELPDHGDKIRIYDLIHQTSGLREWSTLAALRGYPRHYRKIYVLDDLLKLVSSQHALNFKPGERYEYSNSNYGLLTVILERASGMSANEFGERDIFAPLGMRSTRWRDDHRTIVANRAIAYRRSADGFEHAMPMESVYGHGALLTTAEDLQRWNRALLGGGLSPFVRQHMLTPGKLRNGEERAYGAGIRLDTYRGRAVYRHGGVTAGYTAQVWTFPAERVSIAFLCNLQPGDTGQIAARIADAALGIAASPGEQPPEATANVVAPDDVAATYFQSTSGEVVAVKSQGDRTFVNLFTRSGFMDVVASEIPGVLTASRPMYGTLQFRYDSPDRIVVSLEGRERTAFSRMASAKPSLAIAGRYASADLKAAYDVWQQGDGYRMDLADRDADDPLRFRLEWLNGDTFLARIETRSGYIRDDFVVTFSSVTDRSKVVMRLSSVAGLQGVDLLELTRITESVAAP